MNKKKVILLMIITIVLTLGCSSKYDRLMDKYEKLYSETVDLIDTEKIYESVKGEGISANIEQLDNLFIELQKEIPDTDLTRYIALKGKHELLKAIIENGSKPRNLKELDKLVLKEQINILKSNNQ